MLLTKLAKIHYDDYGIELHENSDSVSIRLSKNFLTIAFAKSLIAFVLCSFFVWHGISRGYLFKMNGAAIFFVFLCLLVAVLLPLVLNLIRYNSIKNGIITYNKSESRFFGCYFDSLQWSDVECFKVVSFRSGNYTPYEVQAIVNDGGLGSKRAVLVYAASVRLDYGKKYNVFSSFSQRVNKLLQVENCDSKLR